LDECPEWGKQRALLREAIRECRKQEWGRVIAMTKEERTVWILKLGGCKEGKEVGKILERWVRERERKEAD
jgi:hypothetical protein